MILSNVKRIRREDIKDAPPWIDLFISPFNIFVDTVYNAFNKKITFTDNVQSFYKTLEVTAFPLTIKNELPENPKSVILSQVYLTDAPDSTIGNAFSVEWSIVSDGIKIKNIAGLTAGTKYTVTLLIV